MTEQFDIAIIGAGPGGYVAALHASQSGLKTVCIDKRTEPGGTCLNEGCIPSKSLLSATEFLSRIHEKAKNNGIDVAGVVANFNQMMFRKKETVHSLVEGIRGLFHNQKVAYKVGQARFLDAHRIQVGEEEVEAKQIIIATGAQPIALPGMKFDEKQLLSSTGALSLPQVPQRMIVIGAGVIGVELASVYSRLGTQVKIVEMLNQICPALDQSLSKQLQKALQKQGIEFLLATEVITSVVQPNEVILTVKQENRLQNMSADVVLIAIGRRPHTQGLGLELAGVEVDRRGFVRVDQHFRTNIPHIYAIGDVIEGPMLAHRASAEGVAVVDLICGKSAFVDYLLVPNVIYTHPEVATVGLNEQEAKDLGLAAVIGTSYFKGNGRARCTDETEGFVKVVGDQRSGRLVGMSILGAHASELIAEGMIALQKKATLKDLAKAPHAHPTLSETIKEAAEAALRT